MLNPPDRTPAALATAFRVFAEDARDTAPLYHLLSPLIADDAALLGLAAETRLGQPPPNMLFAAAHYLLLAEPSQPLAAAYPSLGGADRPSPRFFALFRDFCLARAAPLGALLRERITQTNEVRRCALLLPAFALAQHMAGGLPLALVEVGASAGLNLNFDRYAYDYGAGRVGDRDSQVAITTELRGPLRPAVPAELPAVASRVGLDLSPIAHDDEDGLRWLSALIWPEHSQRFHNLRAAIELAQRQPPPLIAGDALELLPELLAEQPAETALCVYHTFVTYQFSPAQRERLDSILRAASRGRPIYRLSCEGLRNTYPEAHLTSYRDGAASEQLIAICDGHLRWMEWRHNIHQTLA
jgi:hypothetical protein